MIIDYKKYPLPKRLRHHTSSNQYIPAENLKIIPNYYPKIISKIDWNLLYLNGKPPDELDIGCGKGLFLLTKSDENPLFNYLGIEIRKPVADWINEYVHGENIKNCGALWHNVVNGLQFIESDTIKSIFYLFPDPWTKQKLKKRRAFNMNTLTEYFRVLGDEGNFYLATDIDEVHKYHFDLLTKFKLLEFKIIQNDEEWGQPPTNKELFCKKNLIKVFKIIAKKR